MESYLKGCTGPYRCSDGDGDGDGDGDTISILHYSYIFPYRRLRGVVATGAMRERLAQGSTPVYPTILVAHTLNQTGKSPLKPP